MAMIQLAVQKPPKDNLQTTQIKKKRKGGNRISWKKAIL
uniref:Uncharacterized protein n=1 Tax=Anguilla anguilla TaxID=7936 RepID=A0A0E9XWS3_ANGAN